MFSQNLLIFVTDFILTDLGFKIVVLYNGKLIFYHLSSLMNTEYFCKYLLTKIINSNKFASLYYKYVKIKHSKRNPLLENACVNYVFIMYYFYQLSAIYTKVHVNDQYYFLGVFRCHLSF